MTTIDFGSKFTRVFDEAGKEIAKERTLVANSFGSAGNAYEASLPSASQESDLIKNGRVKRLDELQKLAKFLVDKYLPKTSISNPEFQLLVPQDLRETEKQEFIKIFEQIDHKKIILTPSVVYYASRTNILQDADSSHLVVQISDDLVHVAILNANRVEDFEIVEIQDLDREEVVGMIIKRAKKLVKKSEREFLAVVVVGDELSEEEKKRIGHGVKMVVV